MGSGKIADDLIERWKALLGRDRVAAEDFYFEAILPPLLAELEQRPAHQALRAAEYHTLVSLMGFSPETTVISAALLRPKALVVVLSEKSEDSYDRAVGFLVTRKILKPSQIEKVTIPPTDARTIYDEIRHAITRGAGKDAGRKRIFDVTGGKKIMSATAGQVAWEADCPLCYIESGAYDPSLRRPLPGHEELILLPSPSQRHARDARAAALALYRGRNYVAAADAFERSMQTGAENRLDCLGLDLCRAYVAWADLNLTGLEAGLTAVRRTLGERRIADLLEAVRADGAALERHLQALGTVARGEPMSLIATFLELAGLYRAAHRHDFACLLAYRAMEAVVEHGLCAVGGPDFQRDAPDYARLGDPAQLGARFVELSQQLGGYVARELPAKIGFINGLMLLCLVAEVHTRMPKPKTALAFVQTLRASAERRNASVLAHGNRTLTESDSTGMLQRAEELAQAVLRVEGWAELQKLRADLAPWALETLDRP